MRCWWSGHDIIRHRGGYLFVGAHGFDGPYALRRECRRCGALWESVTWGRVPPFAPVQRVARWTRGFQESGIADSRYGDLVAA